MNWREGKFDISLIGTIIKFCILFQLYMIYHNLEYLFLPDYECLFQ